MISLLLTYSVHSIMQLVASCRAFWIEVTAEMTSEMNSITRETTVDVLRSTNFSFYVLTSCEFFGGADASKKPRKQVQCI